VNEDLLERLRRALSDRYKVEEELDQGGMAVVYRALDLRHDREVAIKVLHPALSATVGTERFLREIDVVARLVHPNILTLIDSGVVGDLPYYVMPFVEGQSLAALLEREKRLPPQQAVRIACEVAEALETAHRRGVIHRDIKPGNVLLSGGHAVVADFGIAGAIDGSIPDRLTRTGTSIGSPVYMSPEQATGERELDGRTDIYSLGCMLYELLTGEAPFHGSLEAMVTQKVMGEVRPLRAVDPDISPAIERVVARALDKDPDRRFPSADAFREALQQAMPGTEPRAWGRRRTVATALVVLVVAVVAAMAVSRSGAEGQRRIWAARTLAEAEDLADAGRLTEALELAEQVEAAFPADTVLARLLPEVSFSVAIESDPRGARVLVQDFDGNGGEWKPLGTTPLDGVRFAGVTYEMGVRGITYFEDRPHRVRFELDGYRTREILTTALFGWGMSGIPPLNPVLLDPEDPALDGMVRIPGFTASSVEYVDYFMDRFEVTNAEFQEFVDAGGYQDRTLWVHPVVRGGAALSFDQAMALFRDQTGRPGPSTWRLGTFPEGQERYPVGGVSWYEAAAYAEWAGKELPTTTHWGQARRYSWANNGVTVPRSNLGADGPRPVGENDAMSTLGVYDLAGNVREWCSNEVGAGERATRGGAWTDAPFHVGWVIPKDPLDRDPTHGFRLVRTSDDEAALAALRAPDRPTVARDYRAEQPVPDAEFQIFRRLYAYDPYPLNPVLERTDTFPQWVREVVSFDEPYGERGGAAIYLPRGTSRPPFQPVLYWGGSGLLATRSVDEEWMPGIDFFLQTGRAVVVPIFRGAYGREVSNFPGGPGSSTFRDATIQWVKDVSATIDYLETREDIDAGKVGFYGLSFGSEMAPVPLAVEPRIRAAVLNVGGLGGDPFLPEADPFNFVTRVHIPVLMINGEYDIVFPYETAQLPMFELLGTDDDEKSHYVSPSSHIVPQDEYIRETLEWLDRYLGVPDVG
jgi:tRNA A-37 threonylcarbamoyl transferase component Bud32